MNPTRFAVWALLTTAVALAAPAYAPQHYEPPRFPETPAARRAKIETVLPALDQVYRDAAAERHFPGLVWGVVLDGELVHVGATGLANVDRKIPATTATRFRIASMSKSFTALAVLKLRDAGKLSLFDPVAQHLPEFRAVAPLTADAPAITIRHLLTMTPGFPEDNPWGDRQLAVTVEDFVRFIQRGVARANPAGVEFEYSNLAFALLGQIVTRVSGMPYQRYITREILQPLGMADTRYEFSEVPADQLALGYRWVKDHWELEPLLHDGTYGAMGGLLTTAGDFAKYIGFHLAAWPPRDDADNGIARRATVREMQHPAEFAGLSPDAKNRAGEPVPSVSFYAYGLGWTIDSHRVVRVGHSGGLPGFGSNYRFYPNHGVAVFSFANLTYAGTGGTDARASALLIEEARLPERVNTPSATLRARAQEVAALVQSWDPALARGLVAENFFLDRSRDEWAAQAKETLAKAGAIRSVGDIMPSNQLRGTFPLWGEKGRVDVFFTLTPEAAPRLQELRLTFVPAK
jgi:CubicO group peptidase (beta-lactamase class C family)